MLINYPNNLIPAKSILSPKGSVSVFVKNITFVFYLDILDSELFYFTILIN